MVTGEKVFYGSLLVVLLIVLGGKYPKIALSFAGLILLSTIVLNIGNFKQVLDPKSYRTENKSSPVVFRSI